MKAVLFKVAAASVGAALLGGCASVGLRDHRGHVLDAELVTAVQPGVDNKQSVESTLGRPTFVGQFDPNEWYYVSRDTRTLAFRDPKVIDQTVLRVRFDQAGNVTAVDRTGRELIANIDPVGDRTPTLGRRQSFFDELFGNIGAIGQGMPGQQRPPGQ
jgi:outer membrane protein assembly factor BamE (lipoprotein component of BamABCDE complex)